MTSVLVFPAGMPRSLTYLDRALSEGTRVVGASSLRHDPVRPAYPEWACLPYVTEPDFEAALQQLVKDYAITGIYTPNPVVWDYLSRRLFEVSPGVALLNPSPVESETAPYLAALEFAASAVHKPLPISAEGPARPPLPTLELAALYRHAESIPGMCDHEKLRALCELFRFAPQGDVVEIGSWWGKSAFILARLAICNQVGQLLCIDPWSNKHLTQNDEQGLVDRVSVDAAQAFTIFQLNLVPYAQGLVNYLRMPSVEAAAVYRRRERICSDAFGETTYSYSISVLHIDGNHSYECVRSDLEAWADLVVPGGWIVLDDYRWPYGDGPTRVGDAFLSQGSRAVELAFVMGGALFLRLENTD